MYRCHFCHSRDLRDGGQPYICRFDTKKAFDSVKIPILLKHLFNTGKFWRIIKSWYSNSISRVRINNQLSEPFTVERGVKQGSVPFLIVMDTLPKQLREKLGLSTCHTYTGAAIHADDLRTTTTCGLTSKGNKNLANENHLTQHVKTRNW